MLLLPDECDHFFSGAMHVQHLCRCKIIATTYAKVKPTLAESGDRVNSSDYIQVVIAALRGNEGKRKGLLPWVKQRSCFGLRQKE